MTKSDDITDEAQLLDRMLRPQRSPTLQTGDDLVEIGDAQHQLEDPTLPDGSELIDLSVRDLMPLDGVIHDVVVEVNAYRSGHRV